MSSLCNIDFAKFTSTDEYERTDADTEFERVFRTSLFVAKKRGYAELDSGMRGRKPIERKVPPPS